MLPRPISYFEKALHKEVFRQPEFKALNTCIVIILKPKRLQGSEAETQRLKLDFKQPTIVIPGPKAPLIIELALLEHLTEENIKQKTLNYISSDLNECTIEKNGLNGFLPVQLVHYRVHQLEYVGKLSQTRISSSSELLSEGESLNNNNLSQTKEIFSTGEITSQVSVYQNHNKVAQKTSEEKKIPLFKKKQAICK